MYARPRHEPFDDFDRIAEEVLHGMSYEVTTAGNILVDEKGRDDTNMVRGLTEAKIAQALAEAARLATLAERLRCFHIACDSCGMDCGMTKEQIRDGGPK